MALVALAAALPAVLVAVLVTVLAAAALRAGNLPSRGSNSKFTLPASLSQARKALKLRRVRLEMNLSSRSVLPVASSLAIWSRSMGCCRMIWPLLKSQLGVGCWAVGTALLHT
ncbi:hypothetical protein D3C72_2036470 [compost metagenome]